ncbi:MAG TPA: glucose-6-phosphate isomerase family protein [Bacteroidota bacterium]|nr:glucose-6-phosphate isomerase family protein [Bacteroidota bacterium]
MTPGFPRIDSAAGTIDGCPLTRRTLSQMKDLFSDTESCKAILRSGDPLLYTVSTCAWGEGAGDLRCGLGVIQPGRVGSEYFMTRGHLHERRGAPELYVGLRGRGIMLMQREDGSGSTTAEIAGECLVYVPGHTAHRTINTGEEPLVYLGIYPADAGHDYESLRIRNFHDAVILREGRPEVIARSEFIASLKSRG